ncbi:MAG TPA: dihydroorotate dehydrogenase electron transfer subunit [Thermoanaerobaculia bacterium]|nr:dihydroorotate dehydrogenase electron transfer subunit [Thermoanaerobaculia bacterium]
MRSDYRAVLLARRVFSPGFFSTTFEASGLARDVSPGQFVMLEVAGRLRPYLRRAYSVADTDPATGEVEFLVKTIGPGTAALEDLAVGSRASLLGPLGNGFSIAGLASGARVAVVAGGIGAAPFPLLLRSVRGANLSADLFLGGRNAAELGFRARFEGLVPGETVISTDDGSLGERGFITDAFARRAAGASARYARVYACGPMPMFVALARVVEQSGIPAEFSTEAAMGCGFGACLGCVIPGREKPFVISCVEGPILAPQKIDWTKIR